MLYYRLTFQSVLLQYSDDGEVDSFYSTEACSRAFLTIIVTVKNMALEISKENK